MKIAGIGPDDIFHRYLTPKWTFLPTSGAGAAIDGGRFNRPGVEALYLSQAPQTALEEYKHQPTGDARRLQDHAGRGADLSQGFDPDVWTTAGENGIVPGVGLLASTERHHRHGSWRTR